jgi:hypothetical protein
METTECSQIMESKTEPLDAADEKAYSHHAIRALEQLVVIHELNGVHIWTSSDEGNITYTVEYGPKKITGHKLSSTILAAVGRTVYRHCPKCQKIKPIESFITRSDNTSGWGSICAQCNREVVARAGSTLAGRKSKRTEG